MNKLDKNWFVEYLVDVEYKKYVLLAYLQGVHEQFRENKLYPHLSELVWHYKNLAGFIEQKEDLGKAFPADLKGFNHEEFRLVYKRVIADDQLMQDIQEIVEYSLPQFRNSLAEGNDIREEITRYVNFTPVGILPLYKEEGYLLIRDGKGSDTQVYIYKASLYDGEETDRRIVNTTYLDSFRQSLVYTAEHIKNILIRRYREMPNPATYYVETHFSYPLNETLIPIASRLLSRHIATDLL